MTGTDLHFFESLGEADRREALANLDSSPLANETPQWEVQQRIFVHKEHFYYNPLNDLERNVIGGLVTHYVEGEKEPATSFRISIFRQEPRGARAPRTISFLIYKMCPALQQEINAPPPQATQYRARFYWTPYTTAATYWKSEGKRWSKDLDQFAGASDALRAAAAQIAEDTSAADARGRKLYDVVQSLNNTDFTRARSQAEREQMPLNAPKRAEDVWTGKTGTGNQIAALYLALARAAGLEAYGFQVSDRRVRVFDPNYLSTDQLDSLLDPDRGQGCLYRPGSEALSVWPIALGALAGGGIE